MATSNFLQWNPQQLNQETDAQYAADSQRNGGAIDPSPWRSILANKVLYQLSTFITAYAQMMVNKGFSLSDADVNALAAQLANVYTTADGQAKLGYTPVQQGTGVGQGTNAVKLGWDGANLRMTIDVTDIGYLVRDLELTNEVNRATGVEGGLQGQLTTLENAQGGSLNAGPGRGIGTVYQNTGNRPIYVSGFCSTVGGGVGNVTCKCGPGSGSLSSVWANQATATVDGGSAGFQMMVPAGYFYQVVTFGNVGGLVSWTETTM